MTVDARDRQLALAAQVRAAHSAICPDGFEGQGIVICAGGPVHFTNAYVLVHLLRHHLKCNLPIEVWHYGAAELSPRMCYLLQSLGAATVDANVRLAQNPARIRDGWQLKIYALMQSRFREVLLLDADNMPTRDPAIAFEWPQFRDTGAVLWPDVIDLLSSNPIWAACGLEPRTCGSVESGQLLIDKHRCWPTLQVILHLNEEADHYYGMIYGDKDTWLLGMLLMQADYACVPQKPASDGAFCLFQRDFEGAILFQHRTGAKWHFADPQHVVQGFVHLEACTQALSDLRDTWNGLIFIPPARDERALTAERRIADIGHYIFQHPGDHVDGIALLACGDVRAPSNLFARNWHCESGPDGKIHLYVWDAYGPRWHFQEEGAGRWVGRATEEADESPVWLCEAEKSAVSAAALVRPVKPKSMDHLYSPSALLAETLDFRKSPVIKA